MWCTHRETHAYRRLTIHSSRETRIHSKREFQMCNRASIQHLGWLTFYLKCNKTKYECPHADLQVGSRQGPQWGVPQCEISRRVGGSLHIIPFLWSLGRVWRGKEDVNLIHACMWLMCVRWYVCIGAYVCAWRCKPDTRMYVTYVCALICMYRCIRVCLKL